MTTKHNEMKELFELIEINNNLDCPASPSELFETLRGQSFGFENIIEAFELYIDEFEINTLDKDVIEMYERLKKINLILKRK